MFFLCLLPVTLLVFKVLGDELGPDPAKEITLELGINTLRMLLLTLSLTPIRELSGYSGVIRFRRMTGLFVLFYAALHLVAYLWFLLGWEWAELGEDIVKRPYITVGFLAFLLLIPLGLTSTRNMMRRLGKNWKKLHRLIYLTAILGCLHFIWLSRANLDEAYTYTFIMFILLGFRVTRKIQLHYLKAAK